MDKSLLAQLGIYFLIINIIGLYVGYTIIQQGIQPTIVNDNPEDVANSFGLIAYMLLGTGIILLAIKFLPDKLLYWVFKGFEVVALFVTSLIVLFAFIPEEFALLAAISLIVIRVLLPQYLLWRNVSSTMSTIGVGALIGASIGIIPVIVFLVLLAVYDYIAVFKTKHMVVMAKAVSKKNLSFTFGLPTPQHQFELGTGDLVMPLVFGVSVLHESLAHGILFPYAALPSIAVLIASFAGLALTLDYGSKNVGKALPALPLQVGLMVVIYGLLVASGVFG